MNAPCAGRTTCRMHGGTVRVGAESPNWRGNGSRSKYVARNLGERMNEALADPQLLVQSRRIAQMVAGCEELWEKLESAQTIADWTELQRLWKAMWDANAKYAKATDDESRAKFQTEMTDHKAAIENLVEAGASEQKGWDEFRRRSDAARKLIESERKREVEAQQVIALTQITALHDMMAQAIRRHVEDPNKLRAIHAEFVRLTGHGLADTREQNG